MLSNDGEGGPEDFDDDNASIPTIDKKKVQQKIEWVSVLVKERKKDWQLDLRFMRSRAIGKRRIQSRNHVVRNKFVEIENDLLKVAK